MLTPSTPRATAAPSKAPLIRLRRGTVVQIRGDGLIQVGSDPRRRALLPDTNAVRGTLHLLAQGVRLASAHGTDGVVLALREAGVLMEPETDELLRQARTCSRVHVDVPAPWLELALTTLQAAGLTPWAPDDRRQDAPDLALRWGDEAVSRTLPHASADAATLHVSLQDARLRVGPFVQPGDTACPECVEAHLRDRDPFRPVRVAGHGRTVLPHSAPDPAEVDPLMLRHGILLAADDLRAWAEGRQPRSWSATLWVDRTLTVERRAWVQHPGCSCGWQSS